MRYLYQVHGIHCDVCLSRVSLALTGAAGVSSFVLDAARRTVVIDTPGEEINEVDFDRLQKRLRAAGGYELSGGLVTFTRWEIVQQYIPSAVALTLVILFAFARGAALEGWRGLSVGEYILDFFGGMFVVFGLAKMGSWKGFINLFHKTDFIAKRIRKYGALYPLLEVGLGAAFLMRVGLPNIHWVSFALLTSTFLGLLGPTYKKERLSSPALGTLFRTPLGLFTILMYALFAGVALFSASS